MAAASQENGGNEDGKSCREMSGEKTTGLCSIRKASLTNPCKDKIIKVGRYRDPSFFHGKSFDLLIYFV
jgi:hypothetical protein